MPDLKQRATISKSAASRSICGEASIWGAYGSVLKDEFGSFTPTAIPMWVRKLMRKDPQLRLGLNALCSPFFSTPYRLDGGTPDVRGFIRKTFLDAPLFTKVLRTSLNALDFGYQAHEIQWTRKDVRFDPDGPGGESARVVRDAWVIDRIDDLDPEMTELLQDDETREFAGVRFANGEDIDPEKVLLVTHDAEFQCWLGSSVLDPAYPSWYTANWIYTYFSRYLEKKADPPAVGRAPIDARYQDDEALAGQDAADPTEVLGQQLMALKNGGAMVLPSTVDENGNPEYSIDFLTDDKRVDQFLPALQHFQDLKLRALGIPERVLTQDSSVGSFAMAESHASVFWSTRQKDLRDVILTTFTEQIIRRLVEANFGSEAEVPRLEAANLGREGRQLQADILKDQLDTTRTTEDGKTWTLGEAVDVRKLAEANGIPLLRVEDVARAPEEGAGGDAALALNGIQVEKAMALVDKAIAGELPEASAAQMMIAMGVPETIVERMLAPARGFKRANVGLARSLIEKAPEALDLFDLQTAMQSEGIPLEGGEA
jgi:hypothetical protein